MFMKITLGSTHLITVTGLGVLLALLPLPRALAFTIDGGSDYAVLFEGAGGNTMQVTNVTVDGNLGVGNNGLLHLDGPATVGRIDFSAANTFPPTSQFSNNNAANVFMGPFYNVVAVTTALNFLNTLNTTLGAESGTNVNINGSTTINASAGIFHGSDSVFNVTGFNTTNSDILTINGDGVHDVVLNFIGLSANFSNQVVLNGLTSDQVLYNFVGGSGLTGGPTLQVNDNGHNNPTNMVFGDFLNPNGAISVVNTNLFGRVFGGDTHDIQIVSGDHITTTVPDSGSTVLLLSLSLGLLAGVKRKFIS
jgi:VPDSG-CTERM motif